MSKDALWFKHDSNARSDLKIKRMVKRFGLISYAWWWVLIEIMRDQANYSLEYCEDTFDTLSSELNLSSKEAQDFIDSLLDIKLLHKDGTGNLFSARLNSDMKLKDDIKEAARAAALLRWKKQRQQDE